MPQPVPRGTTNGLVESRLRRRPRGQSAEKCRGGKLGGVVPPGPANKEEVLVMPSIPASFHAKSEFPVCSKAVPDLGFREKRHRSVWEVKGEGNDLENCVLARIHAIRFICQLVRRSGVRHGPALSTKVVKNST